MKKNYILLAFLVILVLVAGLNVTGQEPGRETKVMFVDESSDFEISMRVQALVGRLKNREGLEVKTKIAEVEYPTENPLKGEGKLGLDLVIIFPSTIETGRINQVWIVHRPFTTIPLEMRATVREQLNQLKQGISKAFEGKVKPVGVNDDLVPAYFSSLFLQEGILR
ncbi:MAG: hypothetical protein V5A87_04980 [Candidatus Bipolaricaulota bacterium]|nr:hypothetical protein [Candidatus Bipolaricaulota bacterium]MBS3791781.1 hypothetical protein [Candidatus Bipolaricaulota bacterium]